MTTSGLIAILALVVDLITIYISLKEKKLSFLSALIVLFGIFLIIIGGTMWVKGYPDTFQGFLQAVDDYLPVDSNTGSSSEEDNSEESGNHIEPNEGNESQESEEDVKEIFSRVREGNYDDDDLNLLIEYLRENVGKLRENYWSEGDPQLPYISPTYTYIECSTLTEMEVKISDLVESHLKYGSVFSIETGYQDGEPGVCVKAYNEISPPWEEPAESENTENPYIEAMLGDWYYPRIGYLFSISVQDDGTSLLSHVLDYNSDRIEKRSGQSEIDFILVQDPEDLFTWYSSDGTFETRCYPDDNVQWVQLRSDDSYFVDENSLFDIYKITDDYIAEWKEDLTTDKFDGTWINSQTRERYQISLMVRLEDVYGYKDYRITNENTGHSIIMKRETDKLKNCSYPFSSDYYYMVSPLQIDYYDENGMLLYSLEKDG